MGRTKNDWEEARQSALHLKAQLQTLMDDIDNFPRYSDDQRILDNIEAYAKHLMSTINTLVGECSITWANE